MGDGLRWYQRARGRNCFLLFLGYVNVYFLRVNISIAIIPMAKAGNETIPWIGNLNFDWDTKMRGNILASFFYGYIWTQLPGGILAAQYGSKYIMASGVGIPSIITIITPWIAQLPVEVLIISRFIGGFFSGVTFPCNQGLWSRWAPPSERSRLISYAYTGMYIGTAVVLSTGGFISDYLGWPFIFFFTGSSGLLWTSAWLLFVYSSPEEDPCIKQIELEYIQEKIGQKKHFMPVNKHPWKSILTSVPVWANVITITVMNWVLYTLLTQMPTYLNVIYKFPISKSGWASSFPYIMQAIFMSGGGHIADCLIVKKIFRVVTVRKILVILACIGVLLSCCMIIVITNQYVAVIFLCLTLGFCALSWPGFSVNWLDLAPPHASVMMGFGNTFGTIGGVISPVLTGVITSHSEIMEWNIVFFIIIGLVIFNAVFYVIFADGEEQSWVVYPDGN